MGDERASVFSIPLGQRLALPKCRPDSPVTDDCALPQGPETAALAQRIADVDGARLPADVQFELVRLGSKHCPRWVGGKCAVSVATQSGYVIGVAFLTASTQDDGVEKNITEKYGEGPTSRADGSCRVGGKPAVDRTWALQRVTIGYRPDRSCQHGRVLVETETMAQALGRSTARGPATEPKM